MTMPGYIRDVICGTLLGTPVVTNSNLTILVRYDRRVRGGYMNRWLIRERGVEVKPDPNMYRIGLALVMHPDTLARARGAQQ